jgi:hypothetical protein
LEARSLATERGTLGGASVLLAAGGACRPGSSRAFIRLPAGGTCASFPLRPAAGTAFIARSLGSIPLFAPAAVAGEPSPVRALVEFTNRPSFLSNTMVEPAASRPVAPVVATIARDTRAGAEAAANWFWMTSRPGLFSTFHLASLSGVICPVTPRVVTA